MQNNHKIRPSQHRFMKGRSCFTNLICFYDQVTPSVDEGKAVNVIYLYLRKTFYSVSHNILPEKLTVHGLERYTLRWIKNWLDGCAQRVMLNVVKFSWQLITSGVPQ